MRAQTGIILYVIADQAILRLSMAGRSSTWIDALRRRGTDDLRTRPATHPRHPEPSSVAISIGFREVPKSEKRTGYAADRRTTDALGTTNRPRR